MRHQFVRSLAGSRDPNFKNVTLLLHGDGTNGGQNNTFLDSGPNNLTITRNGSVPQGSFSPYGDRWSNYFSASNQYLAYGSNAAFAFGTGDFTIECWYYPTTTSTTNQYAYVTDSVGGLCFGFENGAFVLGRRSQSPADLSYTYNVVANQWLHLVAVRSGSTASLFLNGTRVATGTVTTNYSVTGPVQVGGFGFGYTTVGYLSNLRTVKGTAVYDPTQTTLTIPTAPLTAITNTSLLACQSNRFRDASSNNFTVTRNGDVSVQRFSPFSPDAEYRTDRIAGSAYFSGANSNSLSVSSATANIDTNPFTVESWVYYLGTNNQAWFTPAPGIPFTVVGTTLRVYYATGFLSAGPIERNAWTHIAVTRDFSNVLRVFVNGVLNSSVTTTTAFNSTTPIIGERFGNGTPFVGYIAGFRLLIHTPLYTSNFTPPTSPPAVINDTRWLVNFTNASVRDNAMMNNLETVGNAQIDTTTKKFGTGSLEFDGNGDYLTLPLSENYRLGTGDFTIEMWVYFNVLTNYQCLLDMRNGTTAAVGIVIYTDTGSPNILRFYTAGAVRISTSALSAGRWYHVALTRSGTSTKLFIDGTQAGSTYTDSNNYIINSPRISIFSDAAAGYVNGYIDDLRITKGVARYTSNFTPPTAPFPDF